MIMISAAINQSLQPQPSQWNLMITWTVTPLVVVMTLLACLRNHLISRHYQSMHLRRLLCLHCSMMMNMKLTTRRTLINRSPHVMEQIISRMPMCMIKVPAPPPQFRDLRCQSRPLPLFDRRYQRRSPPILKLQWTQSMIKILPPLPHRLLQVLQHRQQQQLLRAPALMRLICPQCARHLWR